MECCIQTEIEEDEFNYLFKWRKHVFPLEGRGFVWSEPTHHIVARDNGKAVGHIGFGAYTIIGEAEKVVIGVGGVVVRPEYQGRKIPGNMFAVLNSTDTLNAKDRIKTLFCPKRLVSYYENHGYEDFCHGFRFNQKYGYTRSDKLHFMTRGELGLTRFLSIPCYPW